MNTPNHQPSSKSEPGSVQRVMDAITKGTVHMRPRWKFMLEHIALGISIVLVAIGLVYIGSFVSFLWHRAHFSDLRSFGPEGYGLFVRAFPWWHLLFILIGIAAFVYLLRRHTHLYRWPLVVILGVFLVAFVTAATITNSTRLHERLVNRSAAGGAIPFFGSMYRDESQPVQGLITPGVIKKISKNKWTIDAPDDTFTVKITDDTQIPANWEVAVGDMVVVIGRRSGHTITAVEIRPAEGFPHREPFWFELHDDIPIPIPAPGYY